MYLTHRLLSIAFATIGLLELSKATVQPPAAGRGASGGMSVQVPIRSSEGGHAVYEQIRESASPARDDRGDLTAAPAYVDGGDLHGDRESARAQPSAPNSPTDLSFTFYSSSDPWTAEQQAALSAALSDFYPVVKAIYGPPAFTISVNIRKDSTLDYGGAYSPSTNEIVLGAELRLDVLCHEMIHAFHDDDMIYLDTFEEGMARAVEVETFNRLPSYSYWNTAHSYTYDVYYDALNRTEIAGTGGNFQDGFIGGGLLRYQLAGYAWGKVFIENSRFFLDFNRLYYQRVLADPGVAFIESDLTSIAASVQVSVEGRGFMAWYRLQHIFDGTSVSGPSVFQRINQYTVDFFDRSPGGIDVFGNTLIGWAVYDFKGARLDSGSGTTVQNGFIDVLPRIPPDYRGRLWMLAAGQAPGAEVAFSLAVRTAGPEAGVFGAVVEDTQGTVGIVSLDDTSVLRIVPVQNGAFIASDLGPVRGRFLAVFKRPNGQLVVRVFTKDASSYFLML